MKIGKVEGSHEEIKDFFENNGLNLSQYIQDNESPLQKRWLILPSVFVLFSFIGMIFLDLNSEWNLFCFILGTLSAGWLCISVNVRFKNTWGAFLILVLIIVLLLIPLKIIEPQEILNFLKP